MTARSTQRRQGPPARYISPGTRALLQFSFAGKVPARVVEEALREKAIRERRPLPPADRETT